jgi:diguanylate cyclase (GGDEF)-like protein
MMIKPRSANFFARLFVGIGLVIFIIMNLIFYYKSNEIKVNVEQQAQQAVKTEIMTGVLATLKHLDALANDISNWDEVRQQLTDSSYYFYWRDQNLKQSAHFQSYYDQVELYDPDGKRISGTSKGSNKEKNFLPTQIDGLRKDYLLLDAQNIVHLLQFKPIIASDTQQLIGYVGISSQFLSALFSHTQLFFTQKNSIQFDGARFNRQSQLGIEQITEALLFSPIENPINTYLWQLITSFMTQTTAIILLLASIFFWLFTQLIQRPLGSVIRYLQLLKAHPEQLQTSEQINYPIKEFSEINQSIYQFHQELHLAQEQLNQQNALLWTQSRRDGLTNVFNRRAFDEAWLDASTHKHTLFAFVLFDCDFFKALNDSYGHDIGDAVIRITAETIRDNLPNQLSVYRIGGDEFVVMVEGKHAVQVKEMVQNCLTALLDYPFHQIDIREKISFSVGISMISPDVDYPITDLPRQADIAMYKAKQSHQDKIQFYCHQMENDANTVLFKNNLLNTVLDAIHTGRHIEMHYQPIVSLHDNRVYYESLIRLNTPTDRIFPSDIFAVVNRRRLETELDKQVIDKVLLAFVEKKLPIGTGISLNLSGKTLLQSDIISLVSPFLPYVSDYKVVIEVTETSLIEHFDYVSELLRKLRSQGFLIALDDFGSGYSSIRYLANMPVDIIKFDMSLLRALEHGDSKTQTILLSTASMITAAGYQLVVEGVETAEQVQLTKQLGASHIQGYYYGKPSPTFNQPISTENSN